MKGAVFITGATGFLGSYIVAELLERHADRLALLVRARTPEEAERRLWQSLQLHFSFDAFRKHMDSRIDVYLGDITRPGLGLNAETRDRLVRETDSVIHAAASLNRRSLEACVNVNERGTLEVVKIGQEIDRHHGLRRFSNISTVAVAGRRSNETVSEDKAIQWLAPDPDPYGLTKKFAEHMARRLLPEEAVTIFRPSAVIGDTRFPETTQFDMVRAFDLFAKAPFIPLDPEWRIDIVPADYVGQAVATLHQKEKLAHGVYHVSAGEAALDYRDILKGLSEDPRSSEKIFAPKLLGLTSRICRRLVSTPVRWGLARPATLIQVFLEHLKSNTVYDNRRIVEELGEAPAPFALYARPLLKFARDNDFRYPEKPWPENKVIKDERKKEVA